MTTSLENVKVGTEVDFQFGIQKMRGYVLGQDDTLTLIGWKKDEAKSRGYLSWNIKEVSEKAFSHRPKFPVPKQYTDAWWVPGRINCEIISPPKQNNLGFLAVCIAAGAGMSAYGSKPLDKRTVNLNHKASGL